MLGGGCRQLLHVLGWVGRFRGVFLRRQYHVPRVNKEFQIASGCLVQSVFFKVVHLRSNVESFKAGRPISIFRIVSLFEEDLGAEGYARVGKRRAVEVQPFGQ